MLESKNKIEKKGSVLIFALIVMGVTLTASLGVATVSIVERKNAIVGSKTVQSFQIADSVAEIVLKKYADSSCTTLDDLAANLPASYSATCANGVVSIGSVVYGSAEAVFYDENSAALSCSQVLFDAVKMKISGTYSGTTRSVEVPMNANIITTVDLGRNASWAPGVSMAISSDNRPVLVYHYGDGENDTFERTEARVMKCSNAACSCTGDNERNEITGTPLNSEANNSLGIASSVIMDRTVPGEIKPFISYYETVRTGTPNFPPLIPRHVDDPPPQYGGGLEFLKCPNRNCSGLAVANFRYIDDSFEAGGFLGGITGGSSGSMVLGQNNVPVIAFNSKVSASGSTCLTASGLYVARCNNAFDCSTYSSTRIDTDASGYVSSSIAMAVNPQDFPSIIYTNHNANNYCLPPRVNQIKFVRCRDSRCSVFDPPLILKDEGNNIFYFSSVAIAFDTTDNQPRIAFTVRRDVFFAKMDCSGSACSYVDEQIIDSDIAHASASMAISPTDNLPVIVYGKNDRLVVVKCGNSLCSPASRRRAEFALGVSGSSSIREKPAISFDNITGNPVIAFSDYPNGLKVLHCGNASCQ